jgi:hypothetical protein
MQRVLQTLLSTTVSVIASKMRRRARSMARVGEKANTYRLPMEKHEGNGQSGSL